MSDIMINPINLTGKTYLITGASSGIGKDTALLLDKLGAYTVLLGRNEDKLKQTVSEMEHQGHRYFVFDLNDIERIESLFDEICKEELKLDGIVHSAGIDECRPLKLTTNQVLHKIMSINFYSFYELTRVFSKKKFNNGGSIVAISSVAGQRGRKAYSAYCASKAAIDGAMRSLALELATINIRINTVAPSFIQTPMYEQYIELVDGKGIGNILEKQYLGIGTALDVANAVAFLLSDASKFITGTVMSVDGGYLSH